MCNSLDEDGEGLVAQAAVGKTYLVGGAVRDELLGLPVSERDWVVLGTTPEQMLAAGFRQADPEFPVFLHPRSGDEYALARRESKTGSGYRGFTIDASPQVTLQQDLARRDFTVNALARDGRGNLVDLFGGEDDLAERRLRHITPAFCEDPLRILRAARFAAKLDFRLAHATHGLMKQMVRDGAIAELLPQRSGRELNRALVSAHPWRFFEVLQACGALAELLPGLAEKMAGDGAHAAAADATPMLVLRQACAISDDPAVRLAALLLQATDQPDAIEQTLAPGKESLQLLGSARLTWSLVQGDEPPAADQVYGLLNALRAWHRDGRFERVLDVLRAQPQATGQADRLAAARDAALQVDSTGLREQGFSGAGLGEAMARARIAAIARVW